MIKELKARLKEKDTEFARMADEMDHLKEDYEAKL